MSSGMRFLESHEYLKMQSETEGVVGVTDYAQSELGDIVYVELPEKGDKFQKGEVFGSVESVKAASQVYSPVDCEVIDVNERLSGESELINSSPEDEGWMMKIKLSDPSQVEGLLEKEAYDKHCQED